MTSELKQAGLVGVSRVVAVYIWIILIIPSLLCGLLALCRVRPSDFGEFSWVGYLTLIAGFGLAIQSAKRILGLKDQFRAEAGPKIYLEPLKRLTITMSRSCLALILILLGTFEHSKLWMFWTIFACLLSINLVVLKALWASNSATSEL